MIKILRVWADPSSIHVDEKLDLVVELTATVASEKAFLELQIGVKNWQGREWSLDHGYSRPTGTVTKERVTVSVFKENNPHKCYGDAWVAKCMVYKTRLPNGAFEDLIDEMQVDPIYEVL